MAAKWIDLPEGLLDLTAQHIPQEVEDLVVIDSVCKSWHSHLTFDPPNFPLLMLEDNLDQPVIVIEEDAAILPPRCFFNLFTSQIYEFDLPEAYARKCLGAGFGWLLTIGIDLKINLLHPLSRHQISLPPQSAFEVPYDFYSASVDAIDLNNLVNKAVLSSSPHRASCVIMVAYGIQSILAFFRLGSKHKLWIDVTTPPEHFHDIIYHKAQFYAVDSRGSVFVCDISSEDDPKATIIAPIPVGINAHVGDKKYLVESSGNLMLISRVYGGSSYGVDESQLIYYTRDFLVFRMEPSADLEVQDKTHEYPYRWVKVNNLGNRTLFLGNNSSVSFPASSNLKANCIYFTDDNEFISPGLNDLGIFNMEDATIERHYTGPSKSIYSPSLWYI